MPEPVAPPDIWQPLWGSQSLFLTCPFYEALLCGTRGGGKSEGLLMDFAQHCFHDHGPAWRGIVFRENFPQLEDLIATSKRWFPQMGATYNGSTHTWTWPEGEQLLMRHMRDIKDYRHYHGHSYPWIGWEELTAWPNDACYEAMKSCCRSSRPVMPRKIRATTNPLGPGHGWVRERFITPKDYGEPISTKVVDAEGKETEVKRVAIFSSIWENQYLIRNDPAYVASLMSITDINTRKAWLEGSWDVVAGGMFDDVWRPNRHIIDPFAIPKSWRIDRSFDWGSSTPFAVCWWAEADGTDAQTNQGRIGFPRGTLFLIAEWYGWNGKPNEGCRMLANDIARGIREREAAMFGRRWIAPGPADTQIFQIVNGNDIAGDMARIGIRWREAYKASGTRVLGWQKLRDMLAESTKERPERPALYVFATCRQFIRTVPTLPRSMRDPEDVDASAEDHIADAVRYRVFTKRPTVRSVENLI